jgi:aminopeptidase YwaD
VIDTPAQLEQADIEGAIAVLRNELTREQPMPKNFVFYNPEEHQRIYQLLERKKPSALICVTSRDGAWAGGVYPFPLFEDGDFDIPSAYMTREEAEPLWAAEGEQVELQITVRRIPGSGFNIPGAFVSSGGSQYVLPAGSSRHRRFIEMAHR